jgi:hypothetical protein
MKNSDKPTNATLTYNSLTGEPNGHFIGLTKREYFAGLAMHGMLSNNELINSLDLNWIAINAIKQADELLNLLEHDTNI